MARIGSRAFQVLAALALVAASASAQEGVSAPPAAGKVSDSAPAKKAIRARLKLASGRVLEGVLTQGETWEAPDGTGGFRAVEKKDSRAGLRLYFVEGIRDAMFIPRDEIAAFEDLGPLATSTERELTPAEVALAARRRKLEEMERKNREEMERILEEARTGKTAAAPAPAPSPAPAPAGKAGGTDEPEATEEAKGSGDGTEADPAEKPDPKELRRRQGDALLERYPFPDWSEKRANEIKWRERVTDMKRNQEEADFIDGLELWKEALARRNAPAPAAKADDGKTR